MARTEIHRPPITARHERKRVVVTGDHSGIVVTASRRRLRQNPVENIVADTKEQITKIPFTQHSEANVEAGNALLYLAQDNLTRMKRSARFRGLSSMALLTTGFASSIFLENAVGVALLTSFTIASGVNLVFAKKRVDLLGSRSEAMSAAAEEFTEKGIAEHQRKQPGNAQNN